jgi:hypothetical protein
MLDLFGKHVEPGGQLSGITGHQIVVNNVPAIPYEAGCAHYVGDEFRINRCRRTQQQHRNREVIAWMPTIDFFPADVVRHRTARWRGVRAKTMQIINHEPVEYRFKQQYHLLIAIEQGVYHEAETFIEGLPISTVRNCSHRLMFVPAGRMFSGAQRPRLLTRGICLYIDPHTVPVDPDFRFAEAELQPRLLFEDAGLWETIRKLKAQIGSADPAARLHAEALGGRRKVELAAHSCAPLRH